MLVLNYQKMIACSSKGNYRKHPTCTSRRLKGTQEPSLPGYLTIPAQTGNAGGGSCFASAGSEQMRQRQHHHAAQRRDMEELQETPWASQQGHDVLAETQPRHLPIWKVHVSSRGRAQRTQEDMSAASARTLPREQPLVPVGNASLPPSEAGSTVPFHSGKAAAELAGDSTPAAEGRSTSIQEFLCTLWTGES